MSRCGPDKTTVASLVGAPIRDSAGTVVAALGISGPSSRIKPGQIKPLALLVRKAADAVSRDASTRPADD